MAILTFDLCDLDLEPTWQNVSNDTSCQIILKSMHKCRSYGPDKLNLCQYHLTFNCDLDLGPTWKNISNGTSTHQGKQSCQIILKSMHKRSRQAQLMAILTFEHCDLDLGPTRKNVSNGTSPHQGEQSYQIILKSMHKCRSYGPDKLNLWQFKHLTFVTLTLDLPKKIFQMALLLIKANNHTKLF